MRLKEATVKRSTIESYRGLLDGHVLPVLGDIQVARIRLARLEDLQSQLRAKGLKPRTVNYTMSLVKSVLESAVRNEIIAKNPAVGLQSLRSESERVARALTPTEARAFLEAAHGERLFLALFLMLSLGLRRGEVLGLRWRDVNLEQRYLDITCTLQMEKGKGFIFDTPKTRSRQRRLYFPADAVAELRRHKEAQERARESAAEAWNSLDTVITTEVGTPVNPDNLKPFLHRICDRAGVPRVRIHDLRHTHASLVLKSGLVDDKVLSERLGHTDVRFTRRIYQHTYEEQHRAAALPLAALVGCAHDAGRN